MSHLADEGLGRRALAVDEEVPGVRPLVQDDVVAVLVAHDLFREGLGHAVAHLRLGDRLAEVPRRVAARDRLTAHTPTNAYFIGFTATPSRTLTTLGN